MRLARGGWRPADANDGRWDHRSLLDDPGTVVVSRVTAALDTTQATRASLASASMPHGAVVLVTTVTCGTPLGGVAGRKGFLNVLSVKCLKVLRHCFIPLDIDLIRLGTGLHKIVDELHAEQVFHLGAKGFLNSDRHCG